MRTHPPATATSPDPATELNRIVAVLDAAERAGRRLRLNIRREELNAHLITALDDRRHATHSCAAVAAALDLLVSRLAERRVELRRDLARTSGMSSRRLGTTAGLHELIDTLERRATDAGRDRSRTPRPEDVDHLPGTPSAITLRDLLGVLDAESRLEAPLERAAERARPATGSLEQHMRRLQARVSQVAELGQAVVNFEAQRHTNLVWHQANRLEKSFPDHRAEDMLGWGWQGLRTAIRLYDPSLGFAFSTYACSRIVGAIRDGVRSENPVPKRLTTYARKVAAAEDRLTQELHRAPTLAEIAERIGSELAQVQIVPRLAPCASVEEITANLGEKGSVPAWSVSDHDPLRAVIDGERHERIEAALDRLAPEDALAVRLLVMEQVTPAQARQLTGATTRQLRQRSRRGLEALAEYLSDELV